jgi:hypothetical protein
VGDGSRAASGAHACLGGFRGFRSSLAPPPANLSLALRAAGPPDGSGRRDEAPVRHATVGDSGTYALAEFGRETQMADAVPDPDHQCFTESTLNCSTA